MCGILGFHDTRVDKDFRPQFHSALASMERRGPDDHGIHQTTNQYGQIWLGHRRLSIRDLTIQGRQPLANENESVYLVANGEIYNSETLRRELESKGHIFSSRSDCEVILHGYEEWQDRVVERLNGMFAFAIFDKKNNTITLGRDRLGIKPLLYSVTNSSIVFASQMMTIANWPGHQHQPSPFAFRQFLSFGYTHAPDTTLSNIEKLPPAHTLTYNCTDSSTSLKKYWHLDEVFIEGHENPLNKNEAKEVMWELLEKAVDRRLVSDVPLGAFLSGGLDSSTLAAIAAKALPSCKTYCCDFAEGSFSESEGATQVARDLGLSHSNVLLNAPSAQDIRQLVSFADEPTADTSFVAYEYLCRSARKGMTVSLSGDGADELLSGYSTYRANHHHKHISRLPNWSRSVLANSIAPRIRPTDKKVGTLFKLKQFLQSAESSPQQAHCQWRSLWTEHEAQSLLSAELQNELGLNSYNPLDIPLEYFSKVSSIPFDQQVLFVDISTWMVDDILHKVDRASMANSLEVRVPFLDHEFVELCTRIPIDLKRKAAHGKLILREAVEANFPQLNLKKSKSGFNSPVGHWLKTTLREWSQDLIEHASNLTGGWLVPGGLHEKLYQQHMSNHCDHSFKLWALLFYLEWCKQFNAEHNINKQYVSSHKSFA